MKRSSRVLAKKLLLLPPRGSHLHQANLLACKAARSACVSYFATSTRMLQPETKWLPLHPPAYAAGCIIDKAQL